MNIVFLFFTVGVAKSVFRSRTTVTTIPRGTLSKQPLDNLDLTLELANQSETPLESLGLTSEAVYIPRLEQTLEWVLISPPSVHQFDEPPV